MRTTAPRITLCGGPPTSADRMCTSPTSAATATVTQSEPFHPSSHHTIVSARNAIEPNDSGQITTVARRIAVTVGITPARVASVPSEQATIRAVPARASTSRASHW